MAAEGMQSHDPSSGNCPTASHPATKKGRINAPILPKPARCAESDRLLAEHDRYHAPACPDRDHPGRTSNDNRTAVASACVDLRWPPGKLAHKRSSDRKSTRLNSSHTVISYAVFCLKKKT